MKESTVKQKECDRIVGILEDRYAELYRLMEDDHSDCWEDYNYSRKEIFRLLKTIKSGDGVGR